MNSFLQLLTLLKINSNGFTSEPSAVPTLFIVQNIKMSLKSMKCFNITMNWSSNMQKNNRFNSRFKFLNVSLKQCCYLLTKND